MRSTSRSFALCPDDCTFNTSCWLCSGEAALQRNKQPRVYYYQEPSATTAKWGDRVVNIAGDNTSSTSASTASPAPAPAPAVPIAAPVSPTPPTPVQMTALKPTAPAPGASLPRTLPGLVMDLKINDPVRPAASPVVTSTEYEDPYAIQQEPVQNSDTDILESALYEMAEAISHLAMGITTVPFGENEVLVLNSSILSFSSALKAVKRAAKQVGGDIDLPAQRVFQSVSGLAHLLRQLNEDPSMRCFYNCTIHVDYSLTYYYFSGHHAKQKHSRDGKAGHTHDEQSSIRFN